MKKFFFLSIIIAVVFNNNTSASTTPILSLFDVEKENNVDDISKMLVNNGYAIIRDDAQFYNMLLEKGTSQIWLHYTPSSRYIFKYDICKDTLNRNDLLDGPRQVLDILIKKYGRPNYAGEPHETGVKYAINEFELRDTIFDDVQALDTLSLHHFVKGIYSPEKFQYVWKNKQNTIVFRCTINERHIESQWKHYYFYYITNEMLKASFFAERKQIEDHEELMDSLKIAFYVFLVCILIIIVWYCINKQKRKEQINAELEKKERSKKQASLDTRYKVFIDRLSEKYGALTRSVDISYYKEHLKLHEDILIFQQSKIIVFGQKEFKFDDILSCSMFDESEGTHVSQVIKTETGSMFGRAAVGALTLGVAGAVVGAVTAKKESTSKLNANYEGSYVVKIGIKSIEEPTITLRFGSNKSKAEEVYALMQAIIAMK